VKASKDVTAQRLDDVGRIPNSIMIAIATCVHTRLDHLEIGIEVSLLFSSRSLIIGIFLVTARTSTRCRL
jgi:hypothetical protein